MVRGSSMVSGGSTKDEFLMLLLEASAEPIGLLVTTNDAERARQKFYAARRDASAMHPELDQIQIRISPFPDGQLVLVKSVIQVPSTQQNGEAS